MSWPNRKKVYEDFDRAYARLMYLIIAEAIIIAVLILIIVS